HGRAWTEQGQKSFLRRYSPDPSPEDEYIKAHEIESDTITRRKRYFERGGKPYGDAYPDRHTELMKDYMAGGRMEEVGTEEEKIRRLKQNPRFSHEISILEKIIEDLEGKNLKIYRTPKGIVYTFNFDPNHKFSILIGVTAKIDAENEIILEAIFKKYQPFSLSLLDLENEESESGDTIELFKKYSINTTYFIDYKRILAKETIENSLLSLHPHLERLVISEKFLSLTLRDKIGVGPSLELAKEIYEELTLLDFGVVEISEIKCYTCGSVFKTDIEKCKKCGTLRPRCIVCILDLFPSEKSRIIKTPCCGVLAHKKHIVMWLRRKKTCPNCKKSLSRWLKKLE
ncbi:MAG: hypothetical protein ACXAAM_02330, partial [Candidatus Heimdallarchaeaceae archaeon]